MKTFGKFFFSAISIGFMALLGHLIYTVFNLEDDPLKHQTEFDNKYGLKAVKIPERHLLPDDTLPLLMKPNDLNKVDTLCLDGVNYYRDISSGALAVKYTKTGFISSCD